MIEAKVNRQYKDRLFRLVFKEKEALLELYNALNESDYTDTEELTITTLENVLYMTMKNDSSFIIGDVMNLYEHQSSHNPNMPLRGFFYFAELYRKYVDEKGLDLYGSSLVKVPLPRYMVFYNGQGREPDRMELRLSDAFVSARDMEPCIEVRATMLNINLGHNRELMERCRNLWEYAYLIAAIRDEVKNGNSPEKAAGRAIDLCISEGILKDILSRYRTEVVDMILEEYDAQRHIENERNLSREEGFTKGHEEGQDEIVRLFLKLIQDKRLSDMERAANDKEYREQLLSEYGMEAGIKRG